MSLDLLDVMAVREQHERFSRFVNPHTVGDEVALIIKDLEEYYSTHPTVEDLDWSEFATWFKVVKHSAFKEAKLTNFSSIFTLMETYAPTEVAETIIEKYVCQDYCTKIADVALQGAEGLEINFEDIRDLVDNYDSEVDRVSKLDTYVVEEDIISLVDKVVEGGLEWRMKFLNKSIGNLRKGKLVCFAARPNTGKTTWLGSEATYLAPQLEDDEVVLWFNNEEAGSDVKFRVVQCALGWTADEIRRDPPAALAEYERLLGGNKDKIVIVDKADLTVKDAEEYLRRYKAGVIVFDQLWKVHGFEKTSGTDTARLGNVYQWAREIAKQHAPVITVHQVKTEGEGVDYLTPNMLYLSGTVIQGEVDSLILMGRVHESGREQNRYIQIGKNKGAYGKDVDISLREGRCELLIHPDVGEFEES